MLVWELTFTTRHADGSATPPLLLSCDGFGVIWLFYVAPELADFVAPTFEQLCCTALWTLYEHTPIVAVGQWWCQDHEIDVVGLTDEQTLIVGECKYQDSHTDYSALKTLETHTEELRWTPPDGGTRTVQYALFSRTGFTDNMRDIATERDDLRLYTLADVVATLQQ